jgi:hypothetical protein
MQFERPATLTIGTVGDREIAEAWCGDQTGMP